MLIIVVMDLVYYRCDLVCELHSMWLSVWWYCYIFLCLLGVRKPERLSRYSDGLDGRDSIPNRGKIISPP
jgi:hypothetical protein